MTQSNNTHFIYNFYLKFLLMNSLEITTISNSDFDSRKRQTSGALLFQE